MSVAGVDPACSVQTWFAAGEFEFDPCNGHEVRKLDLFHSYQKWCHDLSNRGLLTNELGRNQFYKRITEIFQPQFDSGKQNKLLVFDSHAQYHVFRGFKPVEKK